MRLIHGAIVERQRTVVVPDCAAAAKGTIAVRDRQSRDGYGPTGADVKHAAVAVAIQWEA